jgi:hypothetical protein
MFGRVSGLEDALAGRKTLDLNLRRQDAGFIIVQELEKGNVPQFIWITWHGLPH